MRIAVLSSEFPPKWGGVGNVAYFLVNSMSKHFGHTFDVVTRDMGEDLRKERPDLNIGIEVHEVPFTKLPMYFATSFGKNAVKWVIDGSRGLDICHVHSNMTLLPEESYTTLKERMPVISTMHGTWAGERSEMRMEDVSVSIQGANDMAVMYLSPRFDKYEDHAIELSDAVVAISKIEEGELKKRASAEARNRIVRIPHGVATDTFRPDRRDGSIRERLGIDEDDLHLFFVGRLAGRKGLDTLLDAFTKIVDELEKVKLVVVGIGPRERMLRKEARIRGIDGKMIMLGAVHLDELAAHYATADLTLFPSRWEGFGLVTLESMASGTPCVATRVGAAEEIIEHGKNGYLADMGDTDGIAGAVLDFAGNEDARRNMGAVAREHVLDNYTWRLAAVRYNDLYKTLKEERGD